MYKFAILLISCFLAANNLVQAAHSADGDAPPKDEASNLRTQAATDEDETAPTQDEASSLVQDTLTEEEAENKKDEELMTIYKEYQNCLKIGGKPLKQHQFLELVGDDEISRNVLTEYGKVNRPKENVFATRQYVIVISRFEDFLKPIYEKRKLEGGLVKFARDCLEEAKKRIAGKEMKQ